MDGFFISGADAGELAQTAIAMTMAYLPRVMLALITLLVGLWLINRILSVLEYKLRLRDPTLASFLCVWSDQRLIESAPPRLSGFNDWCGHDLIYCIDRRSRSGGRTGIAGESC
jgi:hypothetical protein